MKDKLNALILIFTRWTTSIFLVDSIVLLLFKGKQAKLYALDVLVILALAFACAVLYVFLIYDRNFSKKGMFLIQIVYFVIINMMVLVTGNFLKWFSFCHINTFCAFESVIIVAYFITVIFSYKTDSDTAKKMNEKLKSLKAES